MWPLTSILFEFTQEPFVGEFKIGWFLKKKICAYERENWTFKRKSFLNKWRLNISKPCNISTTLKFFFCLKTLLSFVLYNPKNYWTFIFKARYVMVKWYKNDHVIFVDHSCPICRFHGLWLNAINHIQTPYRNISNNHPSMKFIIIHLTRAIMLVFLVFFLGGGSLFRGDILFVCLVFFSFIVLIWGGGGKGIGMYEKYTFVLDIYTVDDCKGNFNKPHSTKSGIKLNWYWIVTDLFVHLTCN